MKHKSHRKKQDHLLLPEWMSHVHRLEITQGLILRCLYGSIERGPTQVINSFTHSFTHHVCTELPPVPGTVPGTALWSPRAGAGTCAETSQDTDVSGGTKHGFPLPWLVSCVPHRGACWAPWPPGPSTLPSLPPTEFLLRPWLLHPLLPYPTALGSDPGSQEDPDSEVLPLFPHRVLCYIQW